MGILSFIFSFLPGFANGVLTWLNKKTDAELAKFQAGVGADTTINVEALRARVSLASIENERRKEARESLWTAWMIPSVFAVSLIYFTGIVLDSMSLFGHVVGTWHIVKLPSPWDDAILKILLTGAGIVGLNNAVKRIFTPKA